jgi:hypothetical protein
MISLWAVSAWSVFVASLVSMQAGAAAGSTIPLPRIRVSKDGKSIETAQGKRFVPFGVNYFRPGTGWAPQVWKSFDARAVERDFSQMRSIGINCVRVFLTYGSFLENTNELSSEGLKKFDQFLDIAEAVGIYVHPTGPDHWEGVPSWARKDRIADETVLAALEHFWRRLSERYRGRSVVFAYDLLNEPMVSWDSPVMRVKWNSWLQSRYGSAAAIAKSWGRTQDQIEWGQVPPPESKDALTNSCLLDYQRFREDVADEWTRRQAAAIKSGDPNALVTVGLIQWSVPVLLPQVSQYAAFNPQKQARFLDFLEVHFYPLEHGFYEYASTESETKNLLYLESVVREVAAAGKPVILAEFGWYGGGKLTIDQGRHPAVTETQQAQWCRRAVEVTGAWVCGWLNWGLYDHPEANDVTQRIGLLTSEGQLKEWGREFQRLSENPETLIHKPTSSKPWPPLNWEACITSRQAGDNYRKTLK